MVEVHMRQKNIERRRLQTLAHTEHPGARIEHEALLWQHEASSVPPPVGMVAGRAEEMELHETTKI
jgi:hypothetical protein